MEVLNQAVGTDAGMIAIWVSSAFATIQDQESWEEVFLSDEAIVNLITRGKLAPININADGAFQVVVRIGNTEQVEGLSEREKGFVFLTSQAYRLDIDSKVCVSGIEDVSSTGHDHRCCFEPVQGEYSVVIHMIDWEAEPGMKENDGSPGPNALSDFVVIINPMAPGATGFRTKLVTFDRP